MADGDETATIQHAAAKLTSGDLDSVTDPFALFGEWLAEATASEPNDPTAMALATVDDSGLPDVRMVLLKGFDGSGFVFYTNLESRKGLQLRRTRRRPSASTGNRCGGRCASAGRWSRSSPRKPTTISPAARASAGSEPGRAGSPSRWRAASRWRRRSRATRRASPQARFRGRRIGRGSGSCRTEIEFWRDGAFRLHDRMRFSRSDGGAGRSRFALSLRN